MALIGVQPRAEEGRESMAVGAKGIKAAKRFSDAISGTVVMDLPGLQYPDLFAEAVHGCSARQKTAKLPRIVVGDTDVQPLPQ